MLMKTSDQNIIWPIISCQGRAHNRLVYTTRYDRSYVFQKRPMPIHRINHKTGWHISERINLGLYWPLAALFDN